MHRSLLMLGLLPLSALAQDAMLSEVLVQAQSLQERRQASPTPVFVIGRDEIDITNDLTLGDFLRRQPGVTFTGPPGDPKDVRLMGMDKGYTQILINGRALPGGGKERQVQVDQIPMTMVERVEIIRSPLPDQPGDGIAGAINIVLRERIENDLLVRLSAGVIQSARDTSPSGNVQLTWSRRSETLDAVLPLSVIRRHELKTKPKVTEKFTAGTRSMLAEEFENENNEVAEISVAPRLTWRPTADDTLVFSLFGNRNDGDKRKTREVWTSLTPAEGGNFVPSGSDFENELKERHTVRAGLEWKRRFDSVWESGMQLQWQQAGEDKDRRKDSLDPLGSVTATETEVARMRHDSLGAGARVGWRGLPEHVLAAGADIAVERRDDDKLKIKNGVPEVPGRGDRFRVDEQKQALWLRVTGSWERTICWCPACAGNGWRASPKTVSASSTAVVPLSKLRRR